MSLQLSKKQTVTLNLSKNNNGTLKSLIFGTRWGKIGGGTKIVKKGGFLGFGGKKVEVPTSGGKSVDLDASVFYLSETGSVLDVCYFGRKHIPGTDHSGDDLVGGIGDDDNETIVINTERVPSHVNSIVLTLNSFSGDRLDNVPFTGCRIYEGSPNRPSNVHCTFDIENDETFIGKYSVVLGKMFRKGNGWDFTAIGDTFNHKRMEGLKSEMSAYK